jgi:hypothetical protein
MIMDEKTKKEMLQELTHDDDVEFAKLVPKVKQIVKIKPDGTPVIVCDPNKLSQQEQIIAYLTGKFFAKLVESAPVESASVKEMALALRIESNVIAARLVKLKDNMQVEQVARGEYKISTVSLEKSLDQILKKIGS